MPFGSIPGDDDVLAANGALAAGGAQGGGMTPVAPMGAPQAPAPSPVAQQAATPPGASPGAAAFGSIANAALGSSGKGDAGNGLVPSVGKEVAKQGIKSLLSSGPAAAGGGGLGALGGAAGGAAGGGAAAAGGGVVDAAATAAPEMLAASDVRGKHGIHPGSRPVQGFMDKIRAHEYSYKDANAPGAGHGRFVSPMAQELEKAGPVGKSMVMDTPNGKMVDYRRGLATMLAAQADAHQRIKKLEAGAGSKRSSFTPTTGQE